MAVMVQVYQVAHGAVVGQQAKLDKYAVDGEAAHFAVDADQVDAGDELVADHLLHFPAAEDGDLGVVEPLLAAVTLERLLRAGDDVVDVVGQMGRECGRPSWRAGRRRGWPRCDLKERGMADGGVAQPATPVFAFAGDKQALGAHAGADHDCARRDRVAAVQLQPELAAVQSFHACDGVLDMVLQLTGCSFGKFVGKAGAPDKIDGRLIAERKWIADFAAQVRADQRHVEPCKQGRRWWLPTRQDRHQG